VKARVNGKVLKSQFKNRQTESLIRTAYSSKFKTDGITAAMTSFIILIVLI